MENSLEGIKENKAAPFNWVARRFSQKNCNKKQKSFECDVALNQRFQC